MNLQSLQQEFQSTLLHQSPDFANEVVSTPEASAEQRIDIYQNAYRLRLLEVLDGDFAKLGLLLGDKHFEAVCRAYIDAYPSTQPSLRWFGKHMAKFLKKTRPYASQPVLAEMAAFEWAQNDSFDAAGPGIVNGEEMASIPPENWSGLRLQLHPSVQRLNLDWNVPAMWQALDEDEEPPSPTKNDYPQGWLLWRKDLSVHWRSLEVDEAWAIDASREQAFGEICTGLCEWIDEQNVAFHAAGFLKRWIGDGLVAELNVQAD